MSVTGWRITCGHHGCLASLEAPTSPELGVLAIASGWQLAGTRQLCALHRRCDACHKPLTGEHCCSCDLASPR
jgi:hypothetical protein